MSRELWAQNRRFGNLFAPIGNSPNMSIVDSNEPKKKDPKQHPVNSGKIWIGGLGPGGNFVYFLIKDKPENSVESFCFTLD